MQNISSGFGLFGKSKDKKQSDREKEKSEVSPTREKSDNRKAPPKTGGGSSGGPSSDHFLPRLTPKPRSTVQHEKPTLSDNSDAPLRPRPRDEFLFDLTSKPRPTGQHLPSLSTNHASANSHIGHSSLPQVASATKPFVAPFSSTPGHTFDKVQLKSHLGPGHVLDLGSDEDSIDHSSEKHRDKCEDGDPKGEQYVYFPGAFRPPHRGHFEMVEAALRRHPVRVIMFQLLLSRDIDVNVCIYISLIVHARSAVKCIVIARMYVINAQIGIGKVGHEPHRLALACRSCVSERKCHHCGVCKFELKQQNHSYTTRCGW